ncbi:MAG: glycine cleavage system aminomethyltransferase GcvT [Methanosarcinales archaeon]|nr:glycine cleavage system aminomethyltransferase GcvT [Methanosarcinales archaeon]
MGKEIRTPLFSIHKGLDAKIIAFHGWEMPVEYSGIIDEHKAVRMSAGLFDVSHMNTLKISGDGALMFLQSISTNDIATCDVNGMKYSVVGREDGTFVDDIVIIRKSNGFLLVTNTARKEVLMNWLNMHNMHKENFTIEDVTDNTAILALQGPDSTAILSSIADRPGDIRFWHGAEILIAGIETYTTRSGYTGEDGFEIYCRSEDAEGLWQSIMDAGDVKPVGLGARDSLRLEMGYILSGMDITDENNPLEAGLEWAIKWRKDFIGREALLKIKETGVTRNLVGLKLDRGIPRHGYDILDDKNNKIGIVTSGTISPVLGVGIGLGYVEPGYSHPDTKIGIMIRNKVYNGMVVRTPFIGGRT